MISRCRSPAKVTLGPTFTVAVTSGFACFSCTSFVIAACGSSRSPKTRHSARQVATQAGGSPRATYGWHRLHFSTICFAGS
jgi:hypothetical protein